MNASLQHFQQWLDEAKSLSNTMKYPNAMALTTMDADGTPSVRMVLLKGIDAEGLVFYTNFGSRKGRALLQDNRIAARFRWPEQGREAEVAGVVMPVKDDEADAYFASRPYMSRIGAWASRQSRPMIGRWVFFLRVGWMMVRFAGRPVPRPPFWSGFRIYPERWAFYERKSVVTPPQR